MTTSRYGQLPPAAGPQPPASALGDLAPLDDAQAIAEADAGRSGTLGFLLRRMRLKSDFPALSDSVLRIQRVASSENQSVADLTHEILKDVALTHKLLRLVNSVHYARAGQGTISTVSRAVSLVGFNAVRNIALSLVLLDHMRDKAHAGRMMEEFVRATMAGSVAAELCVVAQDSEEAFIGALFQNLGRMLTEFYFQDEADEIRALVAEGRFAGGEEAAALKVLGLSFEDLGTGVARVWGLPDSLQRCMRRPLGSPPSKLPEHGPERLRWIAMAANDVAATLLRNEPDAAAPLLQRVAERYGHALGLTPQASTAAIDRGREKFVRLVEALELSIAPESAASRLVRLPQDAQADAQIQADDPLEQHELRAEPLAAPAPADAAQPDRERVAAVLVAGIQDVTQVMADGFALNDVLRMIMETMFRALSLRRIVFCMRDTKTDMLTGRFGLGEGSERAVRACRVPLKVPGDLFAAVCIKGADTLIGDATEARVAARLPQWYRDSLNAPAFMLLPLHLKGKPFALIYADHAVAGGIAVDDKELALLRTLRNQAVMAFRQSG